MTAPWPPFVCPACRGPLDAHPAAYHCRPCGRAYPVVAGIPDFRLRPDPWIGIQEDRDKAARVAEAVRGLPFADAVRRYWELTPDTPAERARHFVGHAERALERSGEWLDGHQPQGHDGVWLDLGTGTGDLAAAASARGIPVVAIDIALRWLVVARCRPELAGAHLVCCAAEALPFPDHTFGGAFALGLLEHCPAPEPVAREARRVLAANGRLLLRCVNRYSVLREPHVGVWGVGLMPRRWADAYVRLRTGQHYLHHRPVSARELQRALRRAGFESVRVTPAPPLRAETAALGSVAAVLHPVYDAARRAPVLRSGLRWVAPVLEAEATA